MKLSTSDGLELHGNAWPAADPKAAVAVIHGYAEHSERYTHVAHAFAEAGISSYGVDLRGHGHSPGSRGYVEHFENYHRDVDTLLDWIRAEHPGLPLVLLGHSLGGLISSHYLLDHPNSDVKALVLSSPFLGVKLAVSGAKETAARLMSKWLPKVSLPSGLETNDIMRGPDMRTKHAADSLIFGTANARWYTEASRAQASVIERAAQLKQPTLLLYGGEDHIADSDVTDKWAPNLPNAEHERLAGHYHEIVNEAEAERTVVIDRMTRWITKTVVDAA